MYQNMFISEPVCCKFSILLLLLWRNTTEGLWHDSLVLNWCSHFGVSKGREHVHCVGSSCAWGCSQAPQLLVQFSELLRRMQIFKSRVQSHHRVFLFSSGPSWMRALLKRSTTSIQLPAHPQPCRGSGQWILFGPWLPGPFCSHCHTNPVPQKHLRTEVLSPRRYPVASMCWSHVHGAAMKDQCYLAASSAS